MSMHFRSQEFEIGDGVENEGFDFFLKPIDGILCIF